MDKIVEIDKTNKLEKNGKIFKRHPKVNILDCFHLFFIYWKILGFLTGYNKYLMRTYYVLMASVISIAFPAHLILGTIFAKDSEEIFINGAVSISTFACSLKHFLLRPYLDEILYVNDVLQQFDDRVQCDEDIQYYIQYIRKPSNFMTYFYTVVYFTIAFVGTLTALLTGNILYPAFVIIDWHNSAWKYWLIVLFQSYSLLMQLIQNLTNDIYAPVVLCALSGQVHLLANRVSRIGYDEQETEVENNHKELVTCIEEYKLLLDTTRLAERIISAITMVQFLAVGINVVTILIYLLYFADSLLSYLYYLFHLTSIMIELFPICYYGSMVEEEYYALSYAIFSSNWYTQPRLFRRMVVTFSELTLRDVAITAGGVFRVHLDSFYNTAKMGYSIFTVVGNMKD